MSESTAPYEAYVYALREQVAQHLAGLDELAVLLAQRPLSFNERNAAERGLQVLVEMAVGASKHLLKSRGLPVPAEARAAIERVYETLQPMAPALAQMRGAVGMRNAIIHDYLNLDWERVAAVLRAARYRGVADYIDVLAAELLQVRR
jgi:uncharacterized protein YutE (UPF0331/DUF86 family)